LGFTVGDGDCAFRTNFTGCDAETGVTEDVAL